MQRIAQWCFLLAAAAFSAGLRGGSIVSWEPTNVALLKPSDGPFIAGETYVNPIFDAPVTEFAAQQTGALSWTESDVRRPGLSVVNNGGLQPFVPGDESNCVMSAGDQVNTYGELITDPRTGDPYAKSCSDPFRTSKRFKLWLQVADGSVDMVFGVKASPGNKTYRVFQKLRNATGARIGEFRLQLGFGIGENFTPSREADGVDFTDSHGSRVPETSTRAKSIDLDARFPTELFYSQYELDRERHPIPGFFDPLDGAGFEWFGASDLLTSGDPICSLPELCDAWLSADQVHLGYFHDDDGNPLTDGLLVAYWDGAAWMAPSVKLGANGRPELNPLSPYPADPLPIYTGGFEPVPQSMLEQWRSDADYGIDIIEDLANLNLNYHITVKEVANWPTFDGRKEASFTLRVSTGRAEVQAMPWLRQLPPEYLVLARAGIIASPTSAQNQGGATSLWEWVPAGSAGSGLLRPAAE